MPLDAVPDISVKGLTKRFGDVVAVDAIDLDIAGGEFFTMLGPAQRLAGPTEGDEAKTVGVAAP